MEARKPMEPADPMKSTEVIKGKLGVVKTDSMMDDVDPSREEVDAFADDVAQNEEKPSEMIETVITKHHMKETEILPKSDEEEPETTGPVQVIQESQPEAPEPVEQANPVEPAEVAEVVKPVEAAQPVENVAEDSEGKQGESEEKADE